MTESDSDCSDEADTDDEAMDSDQDDEDTQESDDPLFSSQAVPVGLSTCVSDPAYIISSRILI